MKTITKPEQYIAVNDLIEQGKMIGMFTIKHPEMLYFLFKGIHEQRSKQGHHELSEVLEQLWREATYDFGLNLSVPIIDRPSGIGLNVSI